VRINGTWSLACDGRVIWDRKFVQLWHPVYSPDGSRLAAIVAPKYGRWTIAADGNPWPIMFNDLITDVVFSPDSKKIAATGKTNETWAVAVDGVAWKNTFDRVWRPVFSPDSNDLAVKVERKGRFTIALNDRIWQDEYDAIWDPVFSPAGDKILLRTLQDGKYSRRVIPVETFER
jgi:Tol biopolymer transport system component